MTAAYQQDVAPETMARFDHEKLDVYQLSLQFVAWVADLIDELQGNRRAREISDHMDRASLSILLNIAEGNGKRQRAIRAKFFDDSRGSGTECAACLDALVARRCSAMPRVQHGKDLLLRIVAMPSKLIDRFDGRQQSKAGRGREDQRNAGEADAEGTTSSSSSSSSSSSAVS
jgi:four helix bundle protein